METSKILVNNKVLNYLKQIQAFHFPTVFEFLIALFSSYEKGTTDIEDISVLLDYLELQNLKQIPPDDYSAIRDIINKNYDDWRKLSDPEYCTYALLYEIKLKNILLMIDGKIIEDLSQNIKLTEQSVVTFFDLKYLNNIDYNTK